MPVAPRDSVKISARYPSAHIHAMEVIVQSQVTEYQTLSDLLRAFAEWGIERMAGTDDSPEAKAARAAVQAERDLRMQDRYRQAERVCNMMSKNLMDSRNTDQQWQGETREGVLRFIDNTPFPSLADRMRRELDL